MCINQLDANGQAAAIDPVAIEKVAHAYAAQGMRVLLLELSEARQQ